MSKVLFRFCGVVLTCMVVAPLLWAGSVRGSFERTYQVSGPVQLEALTRSGDISVSNGPAGAVTVRGKIYVGEHWFTGTRQTEVDEIVKNPPIRQDGNNIHIEYLHYHEISVDYEITVPANTTVHTQSGSGDQRVVGLRGSLTLESGSGDMRLRDISAEIHVHTGSGEITAHDISGGFSAEAGSGDIRLETGSGDVQVRTGSGSIELRGVSGAVHTESGSGDVDITGKQTGPWELRTGSGDVEVELPAGAAFDLDASTRSGSVIVDRPITMVVQGNLEKAHRAIRGKVAGGGPELIVRTGSGDVHIR